MFGKKKDMQGQVTAINDVAKDLEKNPSKIEEILDALPRKLNETSGKIPFAEQILAIFYAVKDPKTPIKAKTMLAAALAYFIVPTDLIPDFVIGFGFTDDFAVLTMVLRHLSTTVTNDHHELARRRLQSDEQSSK